MGTPVDAFVQTQGHNRDTAASRFRDLHAASVPNAGPVVHTPFPLGDGIWDDSRHPRDPAEVGLKGGEGMGIIDSAIVLCDEAALMARYSVTRRAAYADVAAAARRLRVVESAERRRCECCGSTAAVATYTRWIGGRGHVLVNECVNKPACWRRQDRQANDRLANQTVA